MYFRILYGIQNIDPTKPKEWGPPVWYSRFTDPLYKTMKFFVLDHDPDIVLEDRVVIGNKRTKEQIIEIAKEEAMPYIREAIEKDPDCDDFRNKNHVARHVIDKPWESNRTLDGIVSYTKSVVADTHKWYFMLIWGVK